MTTTTILATPGSTITGLVLIVDDTPTNLEVISETLSDVGFDVAIATSGERALQQVERRIPDLILLDVMMPGIDGFETCRRLKASPKTCQIPIIFMTALSDTDSKVQALEMGAVDYIAKPFHEKEVLARVKTHLQLRQLTQLLAMQVAKKTAELHASQLQLIQHEKMSALGNLVAGVAHEINNPLGCIIGNVVAVQDAITDLFRVIELYSQRFPNLDAEMAKELAEIDLDYLQQDLPKLVKTLQDSSDRIKSISNSLCSFSRADTDQPIACDIHDGINSTLMILKHRLKANKNRPEIQVITDYGKLPLVECFAGQLNQVFMNILANAIDAFDEVALEYSWLELENNPQKITIQTAVLIEQNVVEICISDNGKGMTEEVKEKIFDHLFTTKDVGKGTGLGLAIARQIVVEKHGGTIAVNSHPGQGTEFMLQLPIHGPEQA